MQPNYLSNIYQPQNVQYPTQNPIQTQGAQGNNAGASAVSINIIGPQAYATNPNQANNTMAPNGFYPMYGANQNPAMPFYPANYNNIFNPYQMMNNQPQMPDNSMNALNNAQTAETGKVEEAQQAPTEAKTEETEKKDDDKKADDEKSKKITPLTDEYVKSLENYLNNDNPKVRLIGAKELMERFKEDDNRQDNPSLIPLLNKTLRDTSSAVRFLGLTTLQLGYSVGNDETVAILKEIQSQNQDKVGEDSLLASEILLKLSAPASVEVESEAK